MLHRNNSTYVVTLAKNHYINQPIKERDRAERPSSGRKFKRPEAKLPAFLFCAWV
jgi:hypothetical protein